MVLQKALALLMSALQFVFFPFASLLTMGKLSTAPLDCIKDAHYSDASDQLCDPEAAPEAQALMTYLKKIYGKYTLSGQYISPYDDYTKPQFLSDGAPDVLLTKELTALTKVNGNKLPAVLGFDFTGVEFPAQWTDWMTQFALQWHEKGGIVTFCWHMTVPQDMTQDPSTWSRWASAIYGKDTNFSLKSALADKNSASYQWLLQSIANVAAQLRVLQAAGVPVLWRPLHEAAGKWFWWGADGAEAYIELYRLLYEKLTGEYGLHNLIWVWNGQDLGWYPGDAYVDLLSDDPYPIADLPWLTKLDPAYATRFKYTARASNGRMVAMSENDTLPNPDMMWNQNVKWLMFCTWTGNRLLKPDPNDQPYGFLAEVSEEYNSKETLYNVYNDKRVLTLDELE